MACACWTGWWRTISKAKPAAPGDAGPFDLAVLFSDGDAGLPNRAATRLRDGFDARGQTIRLDLADGAEAAGGRAWAALGDTPVLQIESDDPVKAVALACGAVLRAWLPVGFKAGQLQVVTPDPGEARRLWSLAQPGVAGNLFARDLVVAPANHLTPAVFVQRLQGLSAQGLEVTVRGRDQLAREGFGALSAVGRAGASGPFLVTLRWPGAGPPVALVGKGMCFDTGGISIKQALGMEDMRADMAGAAACAGAMLALARGRAPREAVAVLAIAENATGADSYRPGDVLRSRSGRTIEVIDTDAEGRLALADALHHAVTVHRPSAVIDVATLTGSIVTALGHHHAGLFGNDDGLRDRLVAAGCALDERLWPMPIGARHREDLRSDIADLRQCLSGRQPDACHAAAFLREFVGDTPWAHLDIAGMDLAEEGMPLAAKGMPTGFGARLLAAFCAAP